MNSKSSGDNIILFGKNFSLKNRKKAVWSRILNQMLVCIKEPALLRMVLGKALYPLYKGLSGNVLYLLHKGLKMVLDTVLNLLLNLTVMVLDNVHHLPHSVQRMVPDTVLHLLCNELDLVLYNALHNLLDLVLYNALHLIHNLLIWFDHLFWLILLAWTRFGHLYKKFWKVSKKNCGNLMTRMWPQANTHEVIKLIRTIHHQFIAKRDHFEWY